MRAIIERAGSADILALVELMNQFYAESSYALDREWAEASFGVSSEKKRGEPRGLRVGARNASVMLS